MSHLKFCIFHQSFLSISKMTCQLTLFDSKLQVFKPEWTIFGIFNQLLSTQNVNVARFARNVECDFFGRFSNTVLKGTRCTYTSHFRDMSCISLHSSFHQNNKLHFGHLRQPTGGLRRMLTSLEKGLKEFEIFSPKLIT